MKLERYEIETDPDGISIRVNQKANALINIMIGATVFVVALYLIVVQQRSSTLEYALLGVGVLWVVMAVIAYRLERNYKLTKHQIEYFSSGRSAPNTLPAGELSRVSVHEIIRPTGKRKGRVPFPWEVRLMDSQDAEFRQVFKFQKEDNAKQLASLIADFYGVDVRRSRG